MAWCHDFNVNLKYGDSGAEVKDLQIALTKEGFNVSRDTSSYFGNYTASAVVGFQEKYASDILALWGLTNGTGYVGSTTRAKLNEIYGCEVVKSYIKVIFPNGGESWAIGETKRVSWQSSGVNYVRIYIYDETIEGSGSTNYIYDGVLSADVGYYDWTIQRNQLPGGNSLPRNYRIRIDGLNSSSLGAEVVVRDSSDNTFTISSVVQPFTTVPEMVYPVNGQVLNYGPPHGYMFKVKPIAGATGYRYQFLQEGVIVYDNINNLSLGGEFALWPDSPGYSSLKEGDVTVKINTMFGEQSGPIRTITIKLGEADLQPTPITYDTAIIKSGNTVFFDSGIENIGHISTGLFNIKWFVDDVEVGYGSHGGVPNNSVIMNGNSQYTWIATEGIHTIKFVVDVDNHVKESNEGNNTVLQKVAVSSAYTYLTCSDGTSQGQCSTAKPKYCEQGVLIDKCSECGCPVDYNCQKDESCNISSTSVPLGEVELKGMESQLASISKAVSQLIEDIKLMK